jgi:hypothetical protein
VFGRNNKSTDINIVVEIVKHVFNFDCIDYYHKDKGEIVDSVLRKPNNIITKI